MYNHRAATQNQQSAAPSQRGTALRQKAAEESKQTAPTPDPRSQSLSKLSQRTYS